MIWGLIAARLGAETKKRLEPAMPPPVRRDFAQAMLTDVIHATLGAVIKVMVDYVPWVFTRRSHASQGSAGSVNKSTMSFDRVRYDS